MPRKVPSSKTSLASDSSGSEITPEERLNILYSTMEQGVIHQDTQGRIIMANKAASEILGVDFDVMKVMTSENEEWEAVREDGTPFPGMEHPSMTALRIGKEVLGVVMGIRNPRKKARVWIRVDAVPVFGPEKTGPVEVYTVIENITQLKAADDLLIESNERFRNVLRALPMGVFLYELDEKERLILRDSNPAADRILGRSISELLGRTIEEAFPGLSGTDVPEKYKKCAHEGTPWNIEKLPYDFGGIKGTYQVQVFRTEPRKVAVVFFDISERESQLERLLVNNELLDLSPAAISVHDFKGNFLYTNRRNLELHGYTREEFFKLNLHQLDVPESEALIEERMAELKKGREMVFGVRHKRKDGTIVPLQVLTKLTEWGGKTVILSIATDLTERIKAEELLRTSEARYRQLVDNASETILVAQDGRLKFINPVGLELTGYDHETMLSRPFLDFIHPDDRALVAERHQMRLKGSKDVPRYSFRLVTSNGDIRWVEINAVLIEWEGRPATLNFLNDVTDTKLAEEAIRRSEEFYRTLITTSPDPILIYDLQGTILFANEQAARTYGSLSVEDFMSSVKNIGDILEDEHRKDAFASFEKTLKEGRSEGNEYNALMKDGSVIRIEVNSSVLHDHAGRPKSFLSIIRDITPQKRAEEAIKESEEKYRTLLDNLSDAVIEVDISSNIVFASPQIADIFGYELKEVLGRSFLDFIYPDDMEKALSQMERMMGKKEVFSLEIRVLHKDSSIRHVNTTAKIVQNKDGSTSLVGVVGDVTDRVHSHHRIEQEKTRAEFYLDLLSHDIGNIHQGLLGWTALARSDVADPLMRETALQHIDQLGKRSIKLVRNVLLLSRLKDLKSDLKPIDLIPTIRRAMKEVRGLYGNREVNIVLSPTSEKVLIAAEPVIEEVFLNLLHNAVKFQNNEMARVDISIQPDESEVQIDISDHGTGIADEQKKKLFDRHMKGSDYNYSGIGLSLVKELVTRYSGTIKVGDRIEGDPGQGARFTITFHRFLE